MRVITWISRVLVGSLFIVSGLIKANDPLGFAYKLQDYYLVFADQKLLSFFNSGLFMNTAVEMSIIICMIEVVLGIAVLFGVRMKIVGPILLLMIIFFTFLTGFSAITGEVTDCGCFGDALKLTPLESFYKDIVLLLLIIPIFWWRGKIVRNRIDEDLIVLAVALVLIALFSFGVISWGFPLWMSLVMFLIILGLKRLLTPKQGDWAVSGVSLLAVLGFSVYCVSHLPVKDFRAYRQGNNLCELMKEVPPVRKFSYVFKDKSSGEKIELDSFPKNWEAKYEYVESSSEIIKEGEEPAIHDFSLRDDDGNDRTSEFLDEPGYKFLLVMYNLDKASTKAFEEINALQQAAEARGIPFVGTSAAQQKDVEVFRHANQLAFPVYQSDETALKTIIRANPGLLLINGCEVVDKWHWRDIPDMKSLQDELK